MKAATVISKDVKKFGVISISNELTDVSEIKTKYINSLYNHVLDGIIELYEEINGKYEKMPLQQSLRKLRYLEVYRNK